MIAERIHSLIKYQSLLFQLIFYFPFSFALIFIRFALNFTIFFLDFMLCQLLLCYRFYCIECFVGFWFCHFHISIHPQFRHSLSEHHSLRCTKHLTFWHRWYVCECVSVILYYFVDIAVSINTFLGIFRIWKFSYCLSLFVVFVIVGACVRARACLCVCVILYFYVCCAVNCFFRTHTQIPLLIFIYSICIDFI